MIARRLVLSGAAACAISAALPARAAVADPGRPNPMPEELRKSLERDPTAPVLGNPKGDITLSVFFDYNCPHCRKMAGPIGALIASDPRLRVVYREWPVFGEESEFAARASLASLETGRYWQFHTALLAMKDRAAEASVMRVARQLGLDQAALRRGMEAEPVTRHIQLSFQLAEHMGLMGTPTFIAGDEAVFGEQSRADLAGLVGRGRRTLGLA
ncbi:DsbA family protein [Paracoccus shandongensis]|uniref:DsbA family protein n=1 Tax=Paracoccus shandongensis TaxID=2816048 RepID=UPI001A8C82C2|nr:DsbA family protein [Paracoccus shandongensis]